MLDPPKNKKQRPMGAKIQPPLAERAYQQIKKMLWVRDLVPNQKLRYQDIVRHLEMSQTPVILALARLEGEGLVRSEPNKGFCVPELDPAEARELYDMREAIEIFLVYQVASRISDRQLAFLYEIMKEHQSYNSEYYTLERLWCDAKFHLTLASFSGHQVGQSFLKQLFDRLYLRYRPERLAAARMLEAEHEHELIYNALQERNDKKTVELMGQHIRRGSERILEGLQKETHYKDFLAPWG